MPANMPCFYVTPNTDYGRFDTTNSFVPVPQARLTRPRPPRTRRNALSRLAPVSSTASRPPRVSDGPRPARCGVPECGAAAAAELDAERHGGTRQATGLALACALSLPLSPALRRTSAAQRAEERPTAGLTPPCLVCAARRAPRDGWNRPTAARVPTRPANRTVATRAPTRPTDRPVAARVPTYPTDCAVAAGESCRRAPPLQGREYGGVQCHGGPSRRKSPGTGAETNAPDATMSVRPPCSAVPMRCSSAITEGPVRNSEM